MNSKLRRRMKTRMGFRRGGGSIWEGKKSKKRRGWRQGNEKDNGKTDIVARSEATITMCEDLFVKNIMFFLFIV